MRLPRSTRKENSFLKNQKLLRRTGSILLCSFALNIPFIPFVM
jgi:hypothetical protein